MRGESDSREHARVRRHENRASYDGSFTRSVRFVFDFVAKEEEEEVRVVRRRTRAR